MECKAAQEQAYLRATIAEEALAAMKLERDYWEARYKRTEGELFTSEADIDTLRVTLSATRAELDRGLTLAVEERRKAVNALPTPKIGDMATVLVPTDERHIKDLWWWDGARVMIIDIHEDRCLVRTTDGYATWLYRRMLALANQMDVEA